MASARLFQSGFEFPPINLHLDGYNLILTGSPRSGSYSARVTYPGYAERAFPSSSGVRIGYACQATTANESWRLGWYAAGQSGSAGQLWFDYAGSRLVLFIGSASVGQVSVAGCDLGYTGRWSHIGLNLKLSAASGWANVYLNGASVLSYSGSTLPAAYSGISAFRWTPCSGYALHLDDLYIDQLEGADSPCPIPDKRFLFQPANAQGTVAQWSPGQATGSSHWAYVQGANQPEASYLYTAAASQRESFLVDTPTTASGLNLHAVIPTTAAWKTGRARSQDWQLLVGLERTGVKAWASPSSPGFTPTVLWNRQEQDPVTGRFWAASNSAGLGIVLESEIA